jgi:hypothetical protein
MPGVVATFAMSWLHFQGAPGIKTAKPVFAWWLCPLESFAKWAIQSDFKKREIPGNFEGTAHIQSMV